MRVLVYGAGAIGGYLGAHLMRAGHAVTVIVRPETAARIAADGLIVHEASDFPADRRVLHVRLRAVDSLAAAVADGPFDVVLLTMKANDIAATAVDLQTHYPAFTRLISLQNGIGVEEELVAAFGPDRLTAGSVTTPVRRDEQERLLVEAPRRGVVLAPLRPQDGVSPWLEMFAETGIRTAAVADYRSLKWSKALANIIGNASAAILDRRPDRLYYERLTYDLELEMLREALAVMRRLRIPVVSLPGVAARYLEFGVDHLPRLLLRPLLLREVRRGRGSKMPSFHIDLSAGKTRSEVVYYNLAIARAGRHAGVPTPVNETLAAVLLRLVQREQPWDDYRNNPQRLVDEMIAAGAHKLRRARRRTT